MCTNTWRLSDLLSSRRPPAPAPPPSSVNTHARSPHPWNLEERLVRGVSYSRDASESGPARGWGLRSEPASGSKSFYRRMCNSLGPSLSLCPGPPPRGAPFPPRGCPGPGPQQHLKEEGAFPAATDTHRRPSPAPNPRSFPSPTWPRRTPLRPPASIPRRE